MAGSRFDYCAFIGSSEPNVCERTYNALRENLGEAFQGPVQDAVTYGAAMVMGLAQLQLEGAAAQRNPTDCNALLGAVERDLKIIPTFGQSVNDRQVVLAAAKARQCGALESVINAGLTAILGSDFINWRDLDIADEVEIAAGDNTGCNWVIDAPAVNATAFEDNTTAVAHNPLRNIWFAVSDTGATSRGAYSLDGGETWGNANSTFFPLKDWSGICYASAAGTSNFVAVCRTSGGDIQTVATSVAGDSTWTLVDAVEGIFHDVQFANARVVAVGTNVAMYSDDAGATWSAGTIPTGAITLKQWASVAPGNGIWVAVNDLGEIATSPDGATFTTVASGYGILQCVTFGNGVFVAVKSTGTWAAIWSIDGVTWTNCNIPTRALYSVTFCDGLFVAADTATSAYEMWTSTDGKTWASRPWMLNGHGWLGLASKANRIVGVSHTGGSFTLRVIPQPQLVPDWATIKHVTLSDTTMPGSRTVSYAAILTDGNPIKTGDYLTVEPGRLGCQERVLVTASTATTFTATFANPHSSGARATTAPWPTWRSTKRHSIILVPLATLTNRTKLAQVNAFMRKVMPAASTWTIAGWSSGAGYTDPMIVGADWTPLGYSIIGGFLGTDY